MRTIKIIILLSSISLLMTGLNSCSLLKKRVEKTEKQEWKLGTSGKKRIYIENTNGDLKVKRTGDSTRLIITAEKRGKVRADEKDKPFDNISITVDTAGEEIRIKTDIRRNNGLFKRNKGGEVNFTLEIPSGMAVETDITNGDMSFDEIAGDIKINLVNGDVSFAKCTGFVSLKSVNGDIRGNFDSTQGINIETVNGDIKFGGLKNTSVKFDVESEHGRVKTEGLDVKNVSENRSHFYGTQNDGNALVKVRLLNGRIELSGKEMQMREKRHHHDDWNINFDFDDDDDLDVRKPSETKSESKAIDSVKSSADSTNRK